MFDLNTLLTLYFTRSGIRPPVIIMSSSRSRIKRTGQPVLSQSTKQTKCMLTSWYVARTQIRCRLVTHISNGREQKLFLWIWGFNYYVYLCSLPRSKLTQVHTKRHLGFPCKWQLPTPSKITSQGGSSESREAAHLLRPSGGWKPPEVRIFREVLHHLAAVLQRSCSCQNATGARQLAREHLRVRGSTPVGVRLGTPSQERH